MTLIFKIMAVMGVVGIVVFNIVASFSHKNTILWKVLAAVALGIVIIFVAYRILAGHMPA